MARAKELLAGFRDRRVLVVGDVILDRYVRGHVSRISPEAPVPVVDVTAEDARPGGAANVGGNVQSLGGKAVLAGVVGRDAAAEELGALLSSMGIGTEGLLCREDTRTVTKTRVIAEHQQVVRIDREPSSGLSGGATSELCERVSELARGVDAVIVEDYGKGTVSQQVVDALVSATADAGLPVGFDPKMNHALEFARLTLATPNFREACAAAGRAEFTPGPDSIRELRELGDALLRNWHAEVVIVTLGADGMYVTGGTEAGCMIPTKAREVYDVSGAGDTVIAVAILALAGGASHVEAASLANCAAGVVVGKLGTAMCGPGEILDVLG